MGSILEAICKCGFSQELWGGAGMINHEKKCYFPALCEHCKELLVINYLVKYPRFPKCRKIVKFYNDPEIQAKNKKVNEEIVFSWNLPQKELKLMNINYLCPNCNEFSMHFKEIGFFD